MKATSLTYPVKRKRFRWLDYKLQLRFLSLLLGVSLVMGLLLLATVLYHSQKILDALAASGVMRTNLLYVIVDEQLQSLILSCTLGFIVVIVPVLILVAVRSMRYVGPMFAIKRSLRAMADGRWNDARVSHRRHDEFKDVMDLLNQVQANNASTPN